MSTEKPKRITIEDIKKEIQLTWFWYKVCEGCDTVALYENVFCSKCRGYHFNENRKRVIDSIVEKYEAKFKASTDLQLSEYTDSNAD